MNNNSISKKSIKKQLLAAIVTATAAITSQIVSAEESVATTNIQAIYQPASPFTYSEASATGSEMNLMEEKVREWRDPSVVNAGKRQTGAADFAGTDGQADVAMENIRNIFNASTGA